LGFPIPCIPWYQETIAELTQSTDEQGTAAPCPTGAPGLQNSKHFAGVLSEQADAAQF
jgi:hypothetical protein